MAGIPLAPWPEVWSCVPIRPTMNETKSLECIQGVPKAVGARTFAWPFPARCRAIPIRPTCSKGAPRSQVLLRAILACSLYRETRVPHLMDCLSCGVGGGVPRNLTEWRCGYITCECQAAKLKERIFPRSICTVAAAPLLEASQVVTGTVNRGGVILFFSSS